MISPLNLYSYFLQESITIEEGSVKEGNRKWGRDYFLLRYLEERAYKHFELTPHVSLFKEERVLKGE